MPQPKGSDIKILHRHEPASMASNFEIFGYMTSNSLLDCITWTMPPYWLQTSEILGGSSPTRSCIVRDVALSDGLAAALRQMFYLILAKDSGTW